MLKMKYYLVMCLWFADVFGDLHGSDSTDELEAFILDAMKNNVTYEGLDNKTFNYTDENHPCNPYEPPKPDFSAPGRRISEEKCLEFKWMMDNRVIEEDRKDDCKGFLASMIRRGSFPEILFVINSPVIFGGRPAYVGEFPHMGAVGWKAKDPTKMWIFKCGSSLISSKFAITAGHCTRLSIRQASDIADPEPKVVRFGVENINDSGFRIHGNPIDATIVRIIKHPQFSPPQRYYDIALLEFEEEVKFADNVQPACLYGNLETSGLGDKATLSGWGSTERGNKSEKLLTANVDIIDPKTCEQKLRRYRNRNWWGFQDHQICAGKLDGGIDTCQGDSGSPLQVKLPHTSKNNASIHAVVGVTSFGIKCARKDRPGIYTRVASFIDWIEENVWPDETKEA